MEEDCMLPSVPASVPARRTVKNCSQRRPRRTSASGMCRDQQSIDNVVHVSIDLNIYEFSVFQCHYRDHDHVMRFILLLLPLSLIIV